MHSTRKFAKNQESYDEFQADLTKQLKTLEGMPQFDKNEADEVENRFIIAGYKYLRKAKESSKRPNLPGWDEDIAKVVAARQQLKKYIRNGSFNS